MLFLLLSTGLAGDPMAETNAAVTRYAEALKGRVVAVMKESGPIATVDVCSEEAPKIAAQITAETGVRVGRSSLRLRNPKNAGPDWVMTWLRTQGERKAEGLTPSATLEGGAARVVRPIAVDAPCLVCHGAVIAPEIQAALAAKYPSDAATGYALGDLRGAIWGEKGAGPPSR